jgi:UDP-glucuronate decarboxylase
LAVPPPEFTILELARQVIKFVGSGSRIVHRPLPPDDPRQQRPDISKAQDVLSWSPRTPLAEGLKRTIAYFEELLRDRSMRANLLSSATVGAPSSSS